MRELPAGIPMLSSGAHNGPKSGACFMELVSVLAGESFTDHPRCVHPLLGVIARTANDLIGDDQRQALARLAPDAIGTQRAGRSVDAVLVGLVAARVSAALPDSRRPQSALRRAQRQAPPSGGGHARRWCQAATARHYRTCATREIQWMLAACKTNRDEMLLDIVTDAITECRRRLPQPARPPDRPQQPLNADIDRCRTC